MVQLSYACHRSPGVNIFPPVLMLDFFGCTNYNLIAGVPDTRIKGSLDRFAFLLQKFTKY